MSCDEFTFTDTEESDYFGMTEGRTITVDDELSPTSTNPVQNKVVTEAINELEATKQDVLTFDDSPTADSDNPITSGGIFNALLDKAPVIVDSASGSIASFSDGIAAPFKVMSFTVEPVQDLHGQSSPYPAGGGKNKFLADFENQTVNNTTYTLQSDGKVTTSGVPSSAANVVIGHVFLPAGTYILNGCPANGGWGKYRLQVTDYPVVNNLGQDEGNGIEFTISTGMEVAVRIQMYTGAPSSLTFAPMIRLSSVTDATYAPYSNLCPISGWTGANVYRTAEYDPSASPSLSLSWSDHGTVYGGSGVYNGNGTWTIEPDRAAHTFNGSERWDLWNGVFVNYDLTDIKQSDTASSTNNIVIADRFKPNGVTYRASCGDGNIIKVIGANTQIACYSSSFADENAFKASLVSNPMTVVYKLATPTSFTITSAELFGALQGENNVWCDCGSVSVDYPCDTKLYIDRKILEAITNALNA